MDTRQLQNVLKSTLDACIEERGDVVVVLETVAEICAAKANGAAYTSAWRTIGERVAATAAQVEEGL